MGLKKAALPLQSASTYKQVLNRLFIRGCSRCKSQFPPSLTQTSTAAPPPPPQPPPTQPAGERAVAVALAEMDRGAAADLMRKITVDGRVSNSGDLGWLGG